ncbi:dnaJ homolog subfamily C member 25 homolog [Sycon ciliatum]|uniref:dnaJ homolog subfamily C member 25 homolog n=1 Tax=Sycon ciliatum TaxID=27933 RepID=UPI0020A86552|eukprot:scpid61446/ scgid7419/ DnaJ homolog subfamily C member 25 homolog
MGAVRFFILVGLMCGLFGESHGQLDNIYCGRDNCYDVLEITRDATPSEVRKSYRSLARKYHPDKNKDSNAEEVFQRLANAYEILRDEESRTDYDYMLDHPDEMYGNVYRYYRHRVAPKVDLRVVVAVSITIISILQYLNGWQRYNEAIKYALVTPQYRNKAKQRATEQGLLDNIRKGKKSKDEIRQDEEAVLRKVVEESLDIRGGYSKPSPWNILWIHLVLSPYYLTCYLLWLASWHWRYSIKRQSLTDEDKEYLSWKLLKLSQSRWEALQDHEQEDILEREVWIPENLKAYTQEKEDEAKAKLAENSRYKQYRRYMKKNGPGRMTFED